MIEYDYSKAPKAIRNRLRNGTISHEKARKLLGGKPIDEWDLEELARRRPRNSQGSFKGRPPAWLTEEMRDEAWRRFKEYIRGELASGSLKAVARIRDLIDNGDSDRVKLDASKFIVEHIVGKPSQEIEGTIDMSIKGLLAGVVVGPEGEIGMPGLIEELENPEIIDDMQ